MYKSKRSAIAIVAALGILLSFALAACDGKTPDATPAVSQNLQTFIGLVAKIDSPVTLESGGNIAAADLVYGVLTDEEKANEDVVRSKALLDGYKADYAVIKAAADKAAAEEKENRAAQRFVSAVERLPAEDKLKTTDRDAVDEAYALYEPLKAETKAKSDIAEAYAALEAANAKVAELEEEARLLIIKETAEAFISGVADIETAISESDEQQITLEQEDAVADLLHDYEGFDEDVVAYEGVADAKQKLDGYAAEIKVLRDEADVENFLELATALSPAENITLNDERKIINAEAAYEEMSDEAKAAEGVADAFETVKAARAKYAELFAAAEKIRIEKFIAAANNVGTDLDNVDITWFDVLDAASMAYDALTYESQKLPEVEEAFERWNAAQKAFDKKGYKQIPMSDPTLVYSGDNPPHIVLQNDPNMWNPLLEFFKVGSVAELGGKVTMYLNVYIDNQFVARGAFDESVFSSGLLAGTHIIANSAVQNVMRALAAEHEGIVSGGTFGFALSFGVGSNEFIPSRTTAVSAAKVYTW